MTAVFPEVDIPPMIEEPEQEGQQEGADDVAGLRA